MTSDGPAALGPPVGGPVDGPLVRGLLLAAGAGRRYGGPKALARHCDGTPWLVTAVAALRGGDPERPVTVVVGASADEASALVPPGVGVVVAHDWADGMGASLAAGLSGVDGADAVLVTLIDLTDVGPAVAERLLAHVGAGPSSHLRGALARAAYAGHPGHPVLIGRDHLAGVRLAARGDQGARDYLADHGCALVECGDLATGRDVDER